MRRPIAIAALVAVLLLSLSVRLPTLTAARPYINYVDEGNFLHPVADMLRAGRWEPHWYLYPSLPLIAVCTAARLSAPVRGWDPQASLLPRRGLYDRLDPALLLTGRAVSLLVGLGIVLLAGCIGWRLGGEAAGWASLLLTAFAPPLVIRGAIASVDPYAALFVVAALLFTDRLRVADRPAREACLAGAMVGLALASKYPALLVGVVPAWIILRSARPWGEKVRLLLLVVLGGIAGAVAGLPGLVLHPQDVWSSLLRQGELYRTLASPAPLWHQALVRAEWDLPYEHPELGIVFVVLALAGLAAAWRDPELRTTAQAWSLYAGAALLLFGRYSFHPFRNLLPLVAPACILVALLYARIRAWLPRPRAADAAGALLLLTFAVPVAAYALERHRLRDSRTEAVDMLQAWVQPRDSVLLLHDLALLPAEQRRIGARTIERRWPRVLATLRRRNIRFVVVGVPRRQGPESLPAADREALLAAYTVRAHCGEDKTPLDPGSWRGNRRIVYLLEKRSAQRR